MPILVVVVGPIASGKSTVATALGARFRSAGRNVAVLDVDDLVDTIGGYVGLTAERFRQSQLVFGRLVGAWLSEGFDVVAHGPFFSRTEDAALLHAVSRAVVPRRVRLDASFEVALERVGADPDRRLSNHPEFLRTTYDRVADLLPEMPPSEWVFDTVTTDPETIVDTLADALLN